jgi:hypothetical protein
MGGLPPFFPLLTPYAMDSPASTPAPSCVVYEQWKPGTVKYYLYTSRVGEFIRGRRYLAHTDAYGMRHENLLMTYDQAFITVVNRLLFEDFIILSYVNADGHSEPDGKDSEIVIADNGSFVDGAPEVIFRYGDMAAECGDYKVVIENRIQ